MKNQDELMLNMFGFLEMEKKKHSEGKEGEKTIFESIFFCKNKRKKKGRRVLLLSFLLVSFGCLHIFFYYCYDDDVYDYDDPVADAAAAAVVTIVVAVAVVVAAVVGGDGDDENIEKEEEKTEVFFYLSFLPFSATYWWQCLCRVRRYLCACLLVPSSCHIFLAGGVCLKCLFSLVLLFGQFLFFFFFLLLFCSALL